MSRSQVVLVEKTKFPLIFKNADKGCSSGASSAEVLECKLDMDFKIRSSKKLLKSLVDDSEDSSAARKLFKVCKKVLANRSHDMNDAISASILINYFNSLQDSALGKGSIEFQLTSDFLTGVVSEFEGPVFVNVRFSMISVGHVGDQERVRWAKFFGTSPSFNEEGDCVFKFESSREKSRFLATIQEGSQFEGDVCIWLLAKSPIEEWTDGGIPLPSAVSMTTKILEKQIDCDFELIAENGKRFPCHKLFLAVSSPVLARMLETECEEMKNKAYQMSLSEEGVKTFLDFIYRAESMESIPSPAVSLELLEAAHKYDVSALEVAMKALFLKQKSEWMEVDVAVMLYLHARNVKGYEPLMWKAVQVIKSKPAELMKSKLFDELLKNDPAAKEILVRAIKTGSPSNESARKKFKRSD